MYFENSIIFRLLNLFVMNNIFLVLKTFSQTRFSRLVIDISTYHTLLSRPLFSHSSLFPMKLSISEILQHKSSNRKKQRQQPSSSSSESVKKLKTIRRSTATDPQTELSLRRKTAPDTNDYQTLADAHLGQALRLLKFETDTGLIKGNAIPPTLLYGEYGDGRGANLVKRPDEIKPFKGLGKKKWKDQVGSVSSQRGESFAGGSASVGNAQSNESSQGGRDNESSHRSSKERLLPKIKKWFQQKWMEEDGDGDDAGREQDKHSKNEMYQLEKQILFHLEKASELGNHHAQNMIANALASGILPVHNYPDLRLSKGGRSGKSNETLLDVPTDFADGGEQLARAVVLWHMSAMDGNIESAMALGYRHRFSAMMGQDFDGVTTNIIRNDDAAVSVLEQEEQRILGDEDDSVENKEQRNKKKTTSTNRQRNTSSLRHSPRTTDHYGVLGTCESALIYYEAAANAVMDEMESGPLRGKVNPALDRHRLAEIHMRGTSSALANYNKPDELEEALQYYRMRASRKNAKPDAAAAYTLATMYHYGLRGVKQDMKLALKYYEIAADNNIWEAAGQAGKFHLWGMGLEEDERDLMKAYHYFRKATPGGLEGCRSRFQKKVKKEKKKKGSSKDDEDSWDFEEDNADAVCDHPAVNGMGLLHAFGIPMVVSLSSVCFNRPLCRFYK